MKKSVSPPSYTVGEEIFNAVSHGVGAVLAFVGYSVLLIKAAFSAQVMPIAASVIYGLALIILYIMSTLYHGLTNKMAKKVFRIFDHCSIFILIAGTYTPYMLVSIKGTLGTVISSVLWGITILGIVLNAVNLEKFKLFSLICYIVMGWCVIMVIIPVINALGFWGTFLLFLGGIFYTGGLIFYGKKGKYMHSIWHLFVLLGSISHYFSILFYVIP